RPTLNFQHPTKTRLRVAIVSISSSIERFGHGWRYTSAALVKRRALDDLFDEDGEFIAAGGEGFLDALDRPIVGVIQPGVEGVGEHFFGEAAGEVSLVIEQIFLQPGDAVEPVVT